MRASVFPGPAPRRPLPFRRVPPMTADSFPTPDSSSPDQLASPPAPVPPPQQVPEAAGERDGDGGGERRRIPIGTQRPGVRPPKLPPRHQFVASATSSVLGDTPLPPVRPAAPPAATEAVTSTAAPPVAPSAAPVPSVSGPVVSAADIEARAAAAGGEAPRDARGGPRRGGDQGVTVRARAAWRPGPGLSLRGCPPAVKARRCSESPCRPRG